jgi:hypothetical protein
VVKTTRLTGAKTDRKYTEQYDTHDKHLNDAAVSVTELVHLAARMITLSAPSMCALLVTFFCFVHNFYFY